MVVLKSIIESFSRCLGTNHEQGGGDALSASRAASPSTLPLGASRERLGLAFDDPDSQPDGLPKGACCSQLPLDYNSSARQEADRDHDHDHFLAQARKKANTARRHRQSSSATSPAALLPSSSSMSRRASLEKARHKSNKRKLDIFRKVAKPSSFSKFIGQSAFPQILCFANPVYDSIDDDLDLYRDDYAGGDDETMASTTYFDAKYEHVVENRQPTPLFREFSVGTDSAGTANDDIIQIFNSGSHKTIQSIYYQNPPPPPDVNTSMMDDTSSSDDCTDDDEEFAEFGKNPFHNYTFHDAPPTTLTASCMPTHEMCKSRNELGVIEDLLAQKSYEVPPRLKLMSKSSNSSAALTPVCSSKSLSPKRGKFPGRSFLAEGDNRISHRELEQRLGELDGQGCYDDDTGDYNIRG